MRSPWSLLALVSLTPACGSGTEDSQTAPPTDVTAASNTANTTGAQTSSTSGGPSGTTASAASGGGSSGTTTDGTTTDGTTGTQDSTGAGGSGNDVGGTGGGGGGADGVVNSSTNGGPTGTPTHEERAALLAVRQEHGVAALDGEVYVLGGFTPDAGPSVQAYDPESDAWRDVADFPAVFHHPNVAVVGNMLYVAGFHLGASLREADGRVYAYDPDTDEWMPRASMPIGTERGASCVATLGDDIYVFGGANDATMPDASVYDTVADEWTQLPLMPALREHCIAAGIDGKIYIVSGRANSIEGIGVESWVYDPVAERYEERQAMPTPRAGCAGGVLAGRIFAFGGEGNPDDPDGIFHEVEAYDPVTDSWQEFPDMLIPRHGFGAAVVGDRIYLAGGGTRQGFAGTDSHTVFFFENAD